MGVKHEEIKSRWHVLPMGSDATLFVLNFGSEEAAHEWAKEQGIKFYHVAEFINITTVDDRLRIDDRLMPEEALQAELDRLRGIEERSNDLVVSVRDYRKIIADKFQKCDGFGEEYAELKGRLLALQAIAIMIHDSLGIAVDESD